LIARCAQVCGQIAKPGGRPPALGLYTSVAMVVCLMRKNLTQQMAGAIFGASQSTVSRRWDLLRPIIKRAVASFIPHPREILGAGTALVDGTITPTWDWRHIPDLFSAKAGYPGMNVQIASSTDGRIAAIGPRAVHGARHDAHAFEASGLKDIMTGISAIGTLDTSVSRASTSPRSNALPNASSALATSNSTPASPRSAPPTSKPSRTSKAGG
jgi:hypothetical protein